MENRCWTVEKSTFKPKSERGRREREWGGERWGKTEQNKKAKGLWALKPNPFTAVPKIATK